MASTSLILHKGAREVTLDELRRAPTPDATATHYPVPFARYLDMTIENLRNAGFEPTHQRYALSRGDMRFFSVIELDSALAKDISLAVAISSAHDRSLPYRFIAGGRTLCCDNLMMSSDMSMGTVRRKHTRNGEFRMAEAVSKAVKALPQFAQTESARIAEAQRTIVTDTEAESLILRALERDIISVRYPVAILREFRSPSYEEFSANGKTLHRLEQAFTTCLGDLAKASPQRYAQATIAIQGLLTGQAPAAEADPTTAA